MRKLMCLMLVLSGLAMGCGSDGGKKDDPNGDNGDGDNAGDGDATNGDGDTDTNEDPATGGDGDATGGDGDTTGGDGDIVIDDPSMGGDKYPMCPRADIPAPTGYTGTKPFSMEEAQACATKCGQDSDCFFACPGAEEWATCVQTEAIACTSKAGGVCKEGYDTALCCQNQTDVVAECDAKPTDQEKGDCFYNKCKADFDGYFNMCVFDSSKPEAAQCVTAARSGCFGNDPDAPTTPDMPDMPIVKPSQQLLQYAPAVLEGMF